MRHPRLVCAVILFASCLTALLLRSSFNYHQVFQDDGVHFQDQDAWFHMRTIQNLMHHFPRRSGFDPYSGFPLGQPINTGPFYDFAIGTVAWIVGLGSPGEWLVDAVGAWFPAILGALIPIPVFFLGRALFHPIAGLAAAALVAILPGNYLMVSRLGDPDHHVAEALLSTLVLLLMVLAIQKSRPLRYGLPAGVCLGCFLATRPAGGFLVVLIAAWAVLQCAVDHWRGRSCRGTWLLVVPMLFVSWLLFLPASNLIWSNFATLELWGGILSVSAAAGLSMLLQWRGAPRWLYFGAVLGAGAVGFAILMLTRSQEVLSLLHHANRYLHGSEERTVAELRPLLLLSGRPSLKPVLSQFGTAWIVALYALFVLLLEPFATPGRTLLLAWSLLMFTGTMLQNRMAYYFSVDIALLAGYAAWLVVRSGSLKHRTLAGALFVALVFLPCIPFELDAVARPDDQTSDWTRALAWLRYSTPEPMGDPAAFYRYYPALRAGETFHYPAGAYGVLAWWDYGHWITAVARRIPVSNGMQIGAEDAARFYLATNPSDAAKVLSDTGARYVIADGSLPMADAEGTSMFWAMPVWAGKNLSDYVTHYVKESSDGTTRVVPVFLPNYYRTMAVHLYLFDGEAVEPKSSTSIIWYREEGPRRKIISTRVFETYEEACKFAEQHLGEKLVLGGLDGSRSCVPLAKLKGYRLAFNSAPRVFQNSQPIGAVKIFEHMRE